MWGEGCFRLVCRGWGDGRLHASRQDSAGRSSGPSVKRVEKLGGSATQVMLAHKSCFVTL
jgi:hypothetical protein